MDLVAFLMLLKSGFGDYRLAQSALLDATGDLQRSVGNSFLKTAEQHLRQVANYEGDPAREYELAASAYMSTYQLSIDSVPHGFLANLRYSLPGAALPERRKIAGAYRVATRAASMAALAYHTAGQPEIARQHMKKAREAFAKYRQTDHDYHRMLYTRDIMLPGGGVLDGTPDKREMEKIEQAHEREENALNALLNELGE